MKQTQHYKCCSCRGELLTPLSHTLLARGHCPCMTGAGQREAAWGSTERHGEVCR